MTSTSTIALTRAPQPGMPQPGMPKPGAPQPATPQPGALKRPRMSYRQAARLMINKHGRNARNWALKRAAELRAEDDLDAAAAWVKISEEVAVQQAELSGG